jgi:hypothetical protein
MDDGGDAALHSELCSVHAISQQRKVAELSKPCGIQARGVDRMPHAAQIPASSVVRMLWCSMAMRVSILVVRAGNQ